LYNIVIQARKVCIDEIDKMSRVFQNRLLNFMESGHVKVHQQKRRYDFVINGAKVFASANDIKMISVPLRSRFRKLFLPRYTEIQFLDVAEKVLPKTSSSISRYIGTQVWKNQGDIRYVISVLSLVKRGEM